MRVPLHRVAAASLLALAVAVPARAGFSGTDVFLCLVGRKAGVPPSEWYTKVWVHNPAASPAFVTYYFLERDKSNPAPVSFADTIQPGETRVYENAVWTLFAKEVFGAIRVVSEEKLVVNERFYSQPAGAGEGDSVGQLFVGIPRSFAIAASQKTELLGVYQTLPKDSSELRYNFGGVEVAGASCRVRFTARDGAGVVLGTQEYGFRAFEPHQWAFTYAFPVASTTNARITAEVASGSGKVLVYGAGIGNGSQDPTTFEMSFADSLLAENLPPGITGVIAGAGLTGGGTSGSVTLNVGAGSGITVSADSISVTGGGVSSAMLAPGAVNTAAIAAAAVTPAKIAPGAVPGQVLMTVATGAAVAGERADPTGVGWAPVGDITAVRTPDGSGLSGGVEEGDATLAIAAGGVTSAMIADGAVAPADVSFNYASSASKGGPASDLSCAGCVAPAELAPGGEAQVLTTSGGAATWAAPPGFALPYDNSAAVPAPGVVFQLRNTASTGGVMKLQSPGGYTFWADATGPAGNAIYGTATLTGVNGDGGFTGVNGYSIGGTGVQGGSDTGTAVQGQSGSGVGVHGISASSRGVYGSSASSDGVYGTSSSGTAVKGETSAANGYAVWGAHTSGVGVYGSSSSGTAVSGGSTSGRGVLGSSSSNVGVEGISGSNIGVKGTSSSSFGVYGSNPVGTGVKGEGFTGVIGTASSSGAGVWGSSGSGSGAYGMSGSGTGVRGEGAPGVWGYSNGGYGVQGESSSWIGVRALGHSSVVAMQAVNDSTGDLFDAFSSQKRFKITNGGDVYADGKYYCGAASGCYNTGTGAADVAERIDAAERLDPGDVVEVDPARAGHFRLARGAVSPLVAGVVSTTPGVTLNNNDLVDWDSGERTDNRPLIALVGRVPVKASAEGGAIRIGDLLVSSATPGHAMRAPASPHVGTVIGKALSPLASGTGTVDMLVMLR